MGGKVDSKIYRLSKEIQPIMLPLVLIYPGFRASCPVLPKFARYKCPLLPSSPPQKNAFTADGGRSTDAYSEHGSSTYLSCQTRVHLEICIW